MILSNIREYADASLTFKSIGLEFKSVNDNVWNLSSYNPQIIITRDNCDKVSKEYPNISYVYPEAQFPNYNFTFEEGFNTVGVDKLPKLDISNECCFINPVAENKLFVQKLNSQYDLDCFGVGFGQSEVKLNFIDSFQVYENYDNCAAVSVKEICKILYLSKWCITPVNYKYCLNIFDNKIFDTYNKQDGQKYASQYTYFSVFARILQECDADISQQLLKEDKLHGKN